MDVYSKITDEIIAALERGVKPWMCPWDTAQGPICRPIRCTGEPYSGINVISLWAAAAGRGFRNPRWMTFRQALGLGAAVRKGEKGAPVVYASTMTRTEETEDGEDFEVQIPFLKSYTVFNVEQIDGLEARYYAAEVPQAARAAPARLAHADAFFAALRADVRHGGDQAFYDQLGDYICVPPIRKFRDAAAYYAVLAHEAAHWSGAAHRLNRPFGRPGTDAYAREELVAELAAAFLCADLGLRMEDREDHAAYLAAWLQALRADKRAIFTAAAHAQRAAAFLHQRQAAA